MTSRTYIVDLTGKLITNDAVHPLPSQNPPYPASKPAPINQLQGRTVTPQPPKGGHTTYTHLATQTLSSPLSFRQVKAPLPIFPVDNYLDNFEKLLDSSVCASKQADNLHLIFEGTLSSLINPLIRDYSVYRRKRSFNEMYPLLKEALTKTIDKINSLNKNEFTSLFYNVFFRLNYLLTTPHDIYYLEFLVVYIDAAILHIKDPFSSMEINHETTLRKKIWVEDWDFVISYVQNFINSHLKVNNKLPENPYLFAFYLIAELEKMQLTGVKFSKFSVEVIEKLLNKLKVYQLVILDQKQKQKLCMVLRGDLLKMENQTESTYSPYLDTVIDYWMLKQGQRYLNSFLRPVHLLFAVQNYMEILTTKPQ